MTTYEKNGIYVGGRKVDSWPPWERTCPRCGRFHNRWLDQSGDSWRCTYCGWAGQLHGHLSEQKEET